MTYVCLWSPRWATGGAGLDELGAALLEVAPRVAVEARGVIWADGRGLPVRELARELVARAAGAKEEVRAGISAVPIAAELAARAPSVTPAQAGCRPLHGEAVQRLQSDGHERGSTTDCAPACAGVTNGRVTEVPPGSERAFLAPLPLELLAPDPRLLALLRGVGVETCGDLAGLSREAVEVRFGAEAGAIRRLALADDRRVLFRPIARERPHASMDFVEYEVREAGRLIFTVNALLGSVCETLDSRGERARSLTLSLALAGGRVKRERLRASRPTSNRDVWLRRLQEMLDRLRLPEPVLGVSLEVEGTEPRSATQGDLFDRGFATAGAVEEAVARLLDEQGPVLVVPEMDGHPLAERRTRWVPREADDVAGRPAGSRGWRARESSRVGGGREGSARLALHLLREPRALGVRIAFRGVQILPGAYLYAGEWHGVAVAAGPDRVSGGRWEGAPFARDYFRCVTEEGRLVWIYRDLFENRWYLHGWWE